jgi:GTP diphosphokinase / guanosine-3',5'-bis(diphosphate) 3'-diphosphatase
MEKLRARSFTLETAIDIACSAFKDRLDKAGNPAVLHSLSVMGQLRGEKARIVGVLHDVVEDTDVTFERLKKLGCPQGIISSLRLLTHSKEFKGTEEEYMKEIRTIAGSGDQIAIDVKWVDLSNNSHYSRNPNPKTEDLKRLEKYERSKAVLRPLVSAYLLIN